MAAQATAVVGVALQLDAPSLNEPLLAFLATRAGITALCAAIVSRQQRASAAALARSARAAGRAPRDTVGGPDAAFFPDQVKKGSSVVTDSASTMGQESQDLFMESMDRLSPPGAPPAVGGAKHTINVYDTLRSALKVGSDIIGSSKNRLIVIRLQHLKLNIYHFC